MYKVRFQFFIRKNAWFQIKEKLRQNANVLLLSATGKKEERIGLDKPFTTWTYKDCLLDNPPTAKLIRVKTFVPGNITLTYDDESTKEVECLEDLSKRERRGLLGSPTWIRKLIKLSVQSWLDFRMQTKMPWQMHIIAPSATDIKDWLFDAIQEILDEERCPIAGSRLTAGYVISNMPELERAKTEKDFKNLNHDVIVSFGVLGRSADYPLLACSCVLRMYDTTVKNNVPNGSKGHHQGPIGRVSRTLGERRLREALKKSNKYQPFMKQILEDFEKNANKQECLILESATSILPIFLMPPD